MALAETIFVDKCEVVSAASTYCSGNEKVITLQIRKADVIEKDGVEIASSFERYVLTPDMDLSSRSEPNEVTAICNVVWTQEVKDAWKAYQESQFQA